MSGNSYLFMLKNAWLYAAGHRRKVILFCTLLACANIVSLGQPYFMGEVFNSIQRNENDLLHQITFWFSLYAASLLGLWAFNLPARFLERTTAFHVRKNFVDKMYGTLRFLPMKWHQDHHSGSVINRINKAGDALSGFSEGQFVYISSFVNFIGPLAVLSFLAPRVAIIALVFAVITIFIISKFDEQHWVKSWHVDTQSEVDMIKYIKEQRRKNNLKKCHPSPRRKSRRGKSRRTLCHKHSCQRTNLQKRPLRSNDRR